MTILSRLKPIFTASVGGCVGGLAVYSLCTFDSDGKNKQTVSNIVIPTDKHEKWDWNWDRRDPASLVKPLKENADPTEQNEYNKQIQRRKPKATRHILLIRHGQYNLDGKTDVQRYLTNLGEVQASSTGDRLKVLNYPYTSLTQSTMTRATQTGNLISKHLPHVPVKSCSMIEEGAPIQPEPEHSHWKPELRVYEDGARIEAGFRKHIHRASPQQEYDSYEIIVCHANVIRYFVCRALQIPAKAWLRFSLNHASITWLTISPSGRVHLRVFGDTGHMPPDIITSS